MTLKQIACLGKELAKFLALFAVRFRSRAGFALLGIYMSRDCSQVCNARISRPSPSSSARRHALYSVSWNRSSGMK